VKSVMFTQLEEDTQEVKLKRELEKSPADAVVTRKITEDVFALGLIPLTEQLARMERSLGALAVSIQRGQFNFQGSDSLICIPLDGNSSPGGGGRRQSVVDSELAENMARLGGKVDSMGSMGSSSNKAQMFNTARSSKPAWVVNLMFQNDMTKIGVTNKKLVDDRFLNWLIWAWQISNIVSNEPERSGLANAFVSSNFFDCLSMGVIFANSFYLAFAADWTMNNIGNGKAQPYHFMIAEYLFTSFFLLELLLRITVHRLFFWTNEEKAWNWFDFILVSLSIVDFLFSQLMTGGGSASNMSFMRILRLLKLAKIFRAFRTLRFFKELAIMMESFQKSFVTLFWSLVMIVFILCIFALIFLQGLSDFMTGEHETLDEATKQGIHLWFGSMTTSILTLYKAVTGGDDWSAAFNVLIKAGAFYGVAFLLFTYFFLFALFNILTGALVEKAAEAAAPDRKDLLLNQRKKANLDAKEFKNLCELMDKDGDGRIDWGEFTRMMENEVFVTYMASVGLEVHDVELFFEAISDHDDKSESIGADHDGSISIDQFVQGCMHMRGVASAIDMQKMLLHTDKMHAKIKEYQKDTRSRFKNIESNLGNLGRIISTSPAYSQQPCGPPEEVAQLLQDISAKIDNGQRSRSEGFTDDRQTLCPTSESERSASARVEL